jgi:hypothetical protein
LPDYFEKLPRILVFSSKKGTFGANFKQDFNRVDSHHIAISGVAQTARRSPAWDVYRQGAGRKHRFLGTSET